ncbi:hypothetical protein [Sphingomonas azotifigens]|uniref:hypothetical protein n=1 Tax=Sphingomonas azotifigens TaxID=330920 RepID=UPI000A02D64F|nr:hypothetical protein [Sphingomonas azotifigens]
MDRDVSDTATATHARGAPYPRPAMRRFRVYALDPRAALTPETATINNAIISLPWEASYEEPLTLGPTGEYLEVVDFDAPANRFYAPLDPNHPDLLAQDGLPPSEGRPQFHQQMAYAVAMKTIRGFERALGRKVLWSSHFADQNEQFIQRLRIYPHALAEANAYYSPEKTALLFGYFRDMAAPGKGSGGWVFTCLSHDIIAHETAHAILHGMHRRSIEEIGPDTFAFHEAFADLVALLQHFTMTEMVAHQISATSGRLQMDRLLSGLAGQFGEATRGGHALRTGIDREIDPATQKLQDPDPTLYQTVLEPHARGAILVGAVFDAFLTIFERRTADLMRIATGRSAPTGEELSRDLVNRLASEAAKAAEHVLRMCVRGLDYLPVTDVTFGEYLRAILTADRDLVPEDPRCYRIILTDAFRRRGIYQQGWLSMAPDSLYWEAPEAALDPTLFADLVQQLDLQPVFRRAEIYQQSRNNQAQIHRWLMSPDDEHPAKIALWEELLGIKLAAGGLASIAESQTYKGRPAVEIHSARIARRSGPDGQEARELIIEVTQRRYAFDDPEKQARADKDAKFARKNRDFIFRGGATLVIDLTDNSVRYAVRKRIDDDQRLDRQRRWLSGEQSAGLYATYFSTQAMAEPFAFAHRQ